MLDMFDQYTPEARRSIFFACAAARRLGTREVESEHLLFGLARENIRFLNRFLRTEVSESSFLALVENAGATQLGSADRLEIPFGEETQRVFRFSEEEAGQTGAGQVGIEHLLLGLLRERTCVAAQLLQEKGADERRIRNELTTSPHRPPPQEQRVLRELGEVHEILASIFKHYTAKAGSLMAYARYLAHRLGSPVVEPEHLLLSLLQEEAPYFQLILPSASSMKAICTQIEEHIMVANRASPNTPQPVSSVSPPFSDQCKRAFDCADEEAELLGSKLVAPEHLLLGILRQKESYAAHVLQEHGADIDRIRQELAA